MPQGTTSGTGKLSRRESTWGHCALRQLSGKMKGGELNLSRSRDRNHEEVVLQAVAGPTMGPATGGQIAWHRTTRDGHASAVESMLGGRVAQQLHKVWLPHVRVSEGLMAVRVHRLRHFDESSVRH